MEVKQINISVPSNLYNKIEKYIDDFGYRNPQDLFLDLARQKVVFDAKDEISLKKEFIESVLKMKKEDFLGVEDSDKLYAELKSKAKV